MSDDIKLNLQEIIDHKLPILSFGFGACAIASLFNLRIIAEDFFILDYNYKIIDDYDTKYYNIIKNYHYKIILNEENFSKENNIEAIFKSAINNDYIEGFKINNKFICYNFDLQINNIDNYFILNEFYKILY